MTEKERVKKIEEFIENNDLDFSATDSALNSACCIVCGYALHLGAKTSSEVIAGIDRSYGVVPAHRDRYYDQIRYYVFDSANRGNYGKWWKKAEAKKMYKF